MDTDELREEILHQRELQKEYRKRLRVLEQQAAKFGIYVPPHIQIEVDELKEKLEACERNVKLHKESLVHQKQKHFTDLLKKKQSLARKASENNPIIGKYISDDEKRQKQIETFVAATLDVREIEEEIAKMQQEISEIENL